MQEGRTSKRMMRSAFHAAKGFFLPEHGHLKPAPFACLVVIAIGLVLLLASLSVFQNLEWALYDRYVEISTRNPTPPAEVIVVAIDDPSFAELGLEWPWPRSLHAALVQSLHEAGARTIVLDIIFDVESSVPEEDTAFVQAVRAAGNVVLAADWEDTEDQNYSVSQWLDPFKDLAQSAQGTGIARFYFDPDGRVRRYPLQFKDRPSLAYATALLQPGFRALENPDIPRLIHFNGRSRLGIQTVSYYQALNPEEMLPKGIFKDKIVFIGLSLASAAAVKHSVDHFLTVFPDPFPGVEVHATVLDSLLSGRSIAEPFSTYAEVSLFSIAFALILVPLFYRRGVFASFTITLGIVFALVVGGFFSYSRLRVQLPVLHVALAILTMFLLTYFYRFVLGAAERRTILRAFKHYLAPAIVEQILKDPSQLRLGGASYDVSIIFTDLENFSTISEKLNAVELHDLLTGYFREMMDILLEERATLDKLIGDAIMVYFGCPVIDAAHPLQACRSALRMQRRMIEFNRGRKEEGYPPLHMRIGINTGAVVAGNMGTETIFNYTILGDNVNLASRLEGVNKEYGTSTIISENTYRQVADAVTARELDRVRVKGKGQAVSIYELVSFPGEIPETKQAVLGAYSEGLAFYRSRHWQEAVLVFQDILGRDAGDGPSRTMLERSRHYRENPPPEDWDGAYTMLHK